ncbi:MAG: hypothetical protein CMJ75_10580 [Planctomycetaceae bacterium]|nr:hypothetical protein [Planctomycetaceae bacterium]
MKTFLLLMGMFGCGPQTVSTQPELSKNNGWSHQAPVVTGAGSTALAQPPSETATVIDFNREIRPLLSDRCFRCHGPDSAQRQAGLRLDTKAGLQGNGDRRPIVVPGDANASALFLRITHADPNHRMPPADSTPPLTVRQIGLIEAWIRQGAVWQKHWSFLPPSRPALPAVKKTEWPRNPIDRFILARLESAGLRPSPRADKETLIRRVTFDLTGLPPTMQEIDTFLADESSGAYESVVERLLHSQQYGERMAMQWLDAARYADSHGYSLDRRRVMWPWRDWVIWAYNQNMPFDQFTVAQIAGDLLPDATVAQQIATGFNRNHPIQSEGGVINEEYRVETVVDRVETTASVFLGLTMGCCRCHDHKYEPFSQEDFYRFYAFFNNVPETAHVGNGDRLVDPPALTAPSVLRPIQLTEHRQRIAALEERVAQERTQGAASRPTERVWIDDELPPGSTPIGNGSGAQEFVFVTRPDHPVFSGKRSSRRTSQGRGQHLIQNANPGLRLAADTTLFSYVYLDPQNPPRQIMLQWNSGRSWDHRAYWGGDHIPWGKAGTSSRRRQGPLPETGKWVRLEVKAGDVGLTTGMTITGWAYTQFDGTVYWDKSGVVDRPIDRTEQRLAALKQELQHLTTSQPTVMVMAEMEPPRQTYVLRRGQYDQPGDTPVTAGLPAALGSLSGELPPNRLALARWLVSDTNPLTARVAVNRYWQLHFGNGLVETPEDFGSQGSWPTHPQLLDWLATEFVRRHWNVREMHKLMVMSATYQQSSRTAPPLSKLDPDNRLLARGPRFRLSAEMIRDQALAVSGLLTSQIGGESVRPYQPPGLWDDVVYQNVPRFIQDHGDKLYRRSLYTYWKRSVPPPNFQAFDAPTREACVLKRSTTNTPLAALVLMNDPTFVEASRKLAERVLREGGQGTATRLEMAFRLTTGRRPIPVEAKTLAVALRELSETFRLDATAAEQFLSVGEAPAAHDLEPRELATYAALVNSLLQLDESVTRR